MNKLIPLLVFFSVFISRDVVHGQYIARQGQITFFSYASVENIEAKNNQVLSIIDLDKQEIAVSMLMHAFVFKKNLMHEHFNESYMESDLFPKATFTGKLTNFDKNFKDSQSGLIEGTITIHGIAKKVTIKTNLKTTKNGLLLTGNFNLNVSDFNIKIPRILSNNIAKVVLVKINFQFVPYENK